ncbi:MAG: hypothetical protein J0H98_00740 [Solirubrobacterales bacterium]|nr:hypothetical protein [Solirubrobacterales bacterium]
MLISAFCWSASADAHFTKPREATTNKHRVLDVDIDVGNRGHVVIAWLERRSSRNGLVALARVKRPGDSGVGPAVRLGPAGVGGIEVEIGAGGLAVVTWPGRDGYLRYATSRPRSAWTSPQTIEGLPANDAVLSVGSDGTAIAGRVEVRGVNDPNARVLAATRMPGSGGFSPWRIVSTDPETVGFDLDVVARTEGRGTVAWSGTCANSGSGNPAYYVDLDGNGQTTPVELSNSRCTVWGLDLESDRLGRQYLKIGTWTGLRLAVREPGSPFPPMSSVTDTYRSANGDLSVSPNGRMTLIWTKATGGGHPTAYQYIRANGGGEPSPVRTMKGVRMNPKKVRDVLLDSAALPNGNLVNLWTRTWTDSGHRFRHTFGLRPWHPGSRFERPRYRFAIPRRVTPMPAMVDTAPDGSQLAWWKEENDRGWTTRVRYTVASWRGN